MRNVEKRQILKQKINKPKNNHRTNTCMVIEWQTTWK
jgi:hypothetical protein